MSDKAADMLPTAKDVMKKLALAEAEEASKEAKKLAKEAKAEHVAVVVPLAHKNGEEHLKLNEKADVTVLIYKEGIIEKNHAFTKDQLKKETIVKVLKDTDVILK